MKNFEIVKNKKIFFIISAVFIIAGIISMFVQGFNWDIDFKGGTEITYNIGEEATDEAARKIDESVRGAIGNKLNVVQASDNDEVILKSLELSSEERDSVTEAIKSIYEKTEIVESNNVSASVSADLRNSAIVSTTIAVVLMLLYITIRFQFSSALASVVCLMQDIFIVISAYSLLQIPVNSNVIAVILTILGYSINATVIIFDRVRENVKSIKNATFEEKVNTSIMQTLGRSINTTVTTLLTIGLIYILGVASIKEFSLPLIVGIIAGLYSSVFLSGSLWTVFKKKNSRIK